MSRKFLSPINLVGSAADPVSGTAGDLYFNTGTNVVKVYNGTTWTVIGSGGGSSVTTSDTAPSSPTSGALWFDSATGQLFIYYSGYWLEVGAGGGSGQNSITAVDGGVFDGVAPYDGGTPSTVSWANIVIGGTP